MDVTATPTPLPESLPVPDYTELLEEISTKLEQLRELDILDRMVNQFEKLDLLDRLEGLRTLDELSLMLDAVGSDLDVLLGYIEQISIYAEYIGGFGLFAIIVVLCYFVYKFFNMFF